MMGFMRRCISHITNVIESPRLAKIQTGTFKPIMYFDHILLRTEEKSFFLLNFFVISCLFGTERDHPNT